MPSRLNALWVGGQLGYLEQACLASAVAVGHPVSLYTYQNVAGVPAGIDVLDAREILTEERLLRHKRVGSVALGSDLFRYELMRRGLGCWIDADVYFLKPLNFDTDAHIFGWEDEKTIGAAVLQIPAGSPLLADLRALVDSDPIIPPWWPPEEQEQQRLLATQGRALPLSEMPWGTIGPKALTYFVKKNGMTDQAARREVFYPIHWSGAEKIFAPNSNIQQSFTDQTKAVHLWNAMIQRQKRAAIDPSSFVAEICRSRTNLG
jgi:hypothetical protein